MGNTQGKSKNRGETKEQFSSNNDDAQSVMETGSLVFSFNVHISSLKSETDPQVRKELWLKYIEKAEGFDLKIPDFPKSGWINTPNETDLSMESHLKGKILLIDFWTYCCINCIHMIPKLHELQLKYKNHPEFAVIGIHTPKFENEKLLKNVINATKRFQIHHPIYNDPKKFMGKAMGYGGWPTLAVVNPKGQLMAIVVGASRLPEIEELIAVLIEKYQNYPDLNKQETGEHLKLSSEAVTSLQFPSAMAVDNTSQRIFVSDSGNNRILVTDFTGTVLEVIGDISGSSGFQDGPNHQARFHYPIGIAFDKDANALYVCDSENHSIRKIDLSSPKREVVTISGSGMRGFDYKGGKKGTEQQLSTPWDCVLIDSKGQHKFLLFSNPGTHQIWIHEINEGISHVLSGTGAESHFNSTPALTAQWAQPSGIFFSQDRMELFICDAESSSIRSIQFSTTIPNPTEKERELQLGINDLIGPMYAEKTRTVVGANENIPQDLALFGDEDGIGSKARLQHPLGVTELPGGLLVIADSYNHKLKLVDPQKNSVTTLSMPSSSNITFNEPHGITLFSADILLVADTNSHRVLKAKLDIKKKLITQIEQFNLSFDKIQLDNNNNIPDDEELEAEETQSTDAKKITQSVTLKPGLNFIQLHLQAVMPKDCHLTEGAPSKVVFKNIEQENIKLVIGDAETEGNFVRLPKQSLPLTESSSVDLVVSATETIPKKFWLKAELKLFFCDETEACHADSCTVELCFQTKKSKDNQQITVTWHPKKSEL